MCKRSAKILGRASSDLVDDKRSSALQSDPKDGNGFIPQRHGVSLEFMHSDIMANASIKWMIYRMSLGDCLVLLGPVGSVGERRQVILIKHMSDLLSLIRWVIIISNRGQQSVLGPTSANDMKMLVKWLPTHGSGALQIRHS